jgi:hypothetical protein
MWSDEARAAALEARRANAKGRAQAAAPAGDHLPITPNPQRKVVTAHVMAQSVGVGGEARPSVDLNLRRIDSKGSPRTKTYAGSAKNDAIIRMRGIDERKYGVGSKSRDMLDPTRNDHLNEILRRAGSPAPRTQPTAGQMVAAGLITKQ